MLFQYSIKTFESFKDFNPVFSLLLISNWCFVILVILSISGTWFSTLVNAFVFSDSKLLIINIP